MAQSQIRASKQFFVDDHISFQSKKITNLANGVASTDAINRSQLDLATAGLAAGLVAPVQNILALQAITVSAGIDKYMCNVEDSGLFRYDAQSSTAADNIFVIQPTAGAGRWIKMSNQLQDHNSLSGIQGGTIGDYQHLTASQLAKATQLATSTLTGLLSPVDWTIFNNKQNALGFTPENAANKGVGNGYASLNASGKVVQDPQNATATPAPSVIAKSNESGDLNAWITGNVAGKTFVCKEAAAGTKNGTNTAFTIAYAPVVGTESVYLNGLLQESGTGNDYTIAGTAITMIVPPLTTDKILVSYFK